MSSNDHPHAAELGLVAHWLLERALPFWQRHALDDRGLAHEQFDFQGQPEETGYRRSLVQFRQIFVFAQAAASGLCGPELARGLFARVAALAWRPEGGWVHRLDAQGAVLDPTIDAYDQAFALLACASIHALDRDAASLHYAERTLAFMDANMREPSGGYAEALPKRLPRRQNPHMHLYEALLALYEASGHAAFLERAERIRKLLHDHFLSASGGLREFFAADWQPLAGASADLVEPGHHFEWVWLLHEHARLARAPVDPAAEVLFQFASTHGLDDRGLPVAGVLCDGRRVDASRKLWAASEALKAHVVRARSRHLVLDANISRVIQATFELFLCHEQAPIWYEGVDAHGAPERKRMPASTLYHLSLSFMEFLRWTGRIEAGPGSEEPS